MEVAFMLGGILLALLLAKLLLQWRTPPGPPVPPGPRGLSGSFEFLRNSLSNNLNYAIDQWIKQYGDIIYLRILGKGICFLTSPAAIRNVTTGETTSLLSAGHPRNFHGEYIMYGSRDLATMQWSEEVVKMRKMFHLCLKAYGDGMDRLEKLMADKIHALRNGIKGTKEFNMSAAIDHSVLSTVHMVLTGEDVTNPARSTDLMRAFISANLEFFRFDFDAVLTSIPLLRFFPGLYGRAYRRMRQLQKVIKEEYFERMKKTYERGTVRGFIDGMLEQQLILREKGEDWLTDNHIKAMIQDVIVGGYATSAGTLMGFFLLMTHYPEVQRRIQEELDRVVGERTPTLRDRPQLPYLEAVTHETMRYISHVAFPPPREATDDILVDGYRIPKGTTILLCLRTAFHDEQAWEQSWEFRPDRFLDDQGQLVPNDHPNRLNYIAFGLGKRRCTGEAFAKSRIFLHIAILLKMFTFRPCADRPEVSPDSRTWENNMVMRPPEFYVTAHPRQESL